MKRTSIATVAATTILTGLTLWLAPASLAQTQIQVTFTEGRFTRYVDAGKPGVGPGDQYLGIHTLTDASSGAQAGTWTTRFEILRTHAGGEDLTFLLDGTMRLSGGDVAFAGSGRYSKLFTPEGITFAVVGATGSFAGDEGTVHVVATEPGVFLATVNLIEG